MAGLKLRLDKELSTEDQLLQEYLEAAFMQAQAPPPYGTGRVLAPDPATVELPPVTRALTVACGRVLVPDARELTAVELDGAALDAVTGYRPIVRDGVIVQLLLGDGRCSHGWQRGYALPQTIVVTGRFGIDPLPANLVDAIYLLAARYWYEREASYADQVAVAEGAGVQTYYRQLPPRTKLVFASYALPTGYAGLA